MNPLRVTVWNENRHENYPDSVTARLYPTGMHGAIATGIENLLGDRVTVRTATLDEPEHGLTASVIEQNRRAVVVGPRGAPRRRR